nr:carbohydrate-binding family 9-like protein [bacterium]
MNSYVLKHKAQGEDPFAGVMPVEITHFHPNGTPGYTPVVRAWASWTDDALHIRMRAYETDIRATRTRTNQSVWNDSCMEFFLNAAPEAGEKYINIEINALGTMLLGYGDDETCVYQDIDAADFDIHPCLELTNPKGYWQLTYTVPFSQLKRWFPGFQAQSGAKLRANFYKCGDETGVPHFGSWNQVDPTKPGRFHCHATFGELVLG